LKTALSILFTLTATFLKSQRLHYHMDTANAKVEEYVYYHPDGCRDRLIRPTDAMLLDSFVSIIKKYPDYLFSIEEHTDCRSDSLYNRTVSQRYSDSFRVFIISRGIDSSRIKAIGKGEDELLITKCKCEESDIYAICTEQEHQQNRRIVLRIIGKRDD